MEWLNCFCRRCWAKKKAFPCVDFHICSTSGIDSTRNIPESPFPMHPTHTPNNFDRFGLFNFGNVSSLESLHVLQRKDPPKQRRNVTCTGITSTATVPKKSIVPVSWLYSKKNAIDVSASLYLTCIHSKRAISMFLNVLGHALCPLRSSGFRMSKKRRNASMLVEAAQNPAKHGCEVGKN